MTPGAFRLPAEWSPQSGVLIAWPHAETDWGPRLGDVEQTYVALSRAVSARQRLVICVASGALRRHASALLAAADCNMDGIEFVEIDYDDTWLRDTGPISMSDGAAWRLLDLRFTGWGGKYEASRDDRIVEHCFAAGLFSASCTHHRVDFALEGGAIESDGAGTLMSTWACLQQRHPEVSRDDLRRRLAELFGAQRVEVLEHGYLQGDDTDAHIDTLARFAPGGVIVHQACDDPDDVHFEPLRLMAEELSAMRSAEGDAYRLRALPCPRPILDGGRRLAASYANYLIINDAVLMPAYGDEADDRAAAVLAAAYPGREIVQVPCRSLIWQNGSLHCITMQLPEGVLHG